MSPTNDTAQLVPFQYEGSAVRTVLIDGEPWFVLADLCKVLGLSSPTRVAERLAADGVSQTQVIDSMGREQLATIVNESGMYEVVIRSDKPEAVAFRRWLTGTVLPEIRKTGSFGATPALTEDEIVHQALQIQSRKVKELESKIADDAPKVDAYNLFIDADGTYSIGSVAKMVGRSQNKLFADLRNNGILIAKGAQRNTPYQKYMHHFAVKAYDFERSDGTHGTSYTPRVQPSGIAFIARKLGLEAVMQMELVDA